MRVVDFVKVLQERQAIFGEDGKPSPGASNPPRDIDDLHDELVMVDPDSGSLCFVGGIIWNDYVDAFQLVPGEVV